VKDDLAVPHPYPRMYRQDRVLRERDAFMTSPMVQDAIIGEAVKQVSESVREKRPDVPWRAVASLRDILVYGCGPDRCVYVVSLR